MHILVAAGVIKCALLRISVSPPFLRTVRRAQTLNFELVSAGTVKCEKKGVFLVSRR